MIRDYVGTFNVPLLTEEIVAEFPTLDDDRLLMFEAIENGIRLHIPDSATPQQLATLDAIVAQHNPSSLSGSKELRQQIVNTAQSAVGITLDDLTTNQTRALLFCLLYKVGAINTSSLTIKELSKWL